MTVGAADTEGKGFREARRRQESLLAPAERRVLVWMARRLPAWVTPDMLTALGLAALAGAGACYAASLRWPAALFAASVFVVANWFGDSLDGTLARVRERQRPRYGFYVDHVVDAVGALFVLSGLAVSGYATPLLAAGVLVAFLLLSIEAYLAAYTLGTFRLSHAWFGPTELRLLLIVGNAVAYAKPRVTLAGATMPFFDAGFAIAVVAMLAVFAVSSIRNARALARAERV